MDRRRHRGLFETGENDEKRHMADRNKRRLSSLSKRYCVTKCSTITSDNTERLRLCGPISPGRNHIFPCTLSLAVRIKDSCF